MGLFDSIFGKKDVSENDVTNKNYYIEKLRNKQVETIMPFLDRAFVGKCAGYNFVLLKKAFVDKERTREKVLYNNLMKLDGQIQKPSPEESIAMLAGATLAASSNVTDSGKLLFQLYQAGKVTVEFYNSACQVIGGSDIWDEPCYYIQWRGSPKCK